MAKYELTIQVFWIRTGEQAGRTNRRMIDPEVDREYTGATCPEDIERAYLDKIPEDPLELIRFEASARRWEDRV